MLAALAVAGQTRMTIFHEPANPKRSVIPVFPVPVYTGRVTDDQDFNDMLEREVEKIRDNDPEGVEICKEEYPGGYTSFFSKPHLYREPQFKELTEQILAHGRFYCQIMGFGTDDPPLKFTLFFATINSKSSYHELHRHRNSLISGTYYIFSDKTSAKISFLDPKAGLRMHEPSENNASTIFNALEFSVQPRSGMTVMFPSWLEHRVEMQRGDRARVSMSFNLDLVKD